MLVLLGCLHRDWLSPGTGGSIIDNEFTDKMWKTFNDMFSLPQGFLQVHNSLDLIERCDERLLPLWPISPGPFTRHSSLLLSRPSAVPSAWNSNTNLLNVYNKVRSFGVPNVRGARIVVNNDFKREVWLRFLEDYSDLHVVEHMQFGWPAGYESTVRPALGLSNHPSAEAHSKEIDGYLEKELSHDALIGPFNEAPFSWQRVNPMMVRPKKEANKYRVILDLSFPDSESVNSFIPRLSYDGSPYKLRLPTALDMAELIAKEGRYCYLFKLDLSRAYRQLPCDPLDWLLLGIKWKDKFYLDKRIPFGLRHGAMNCQRVTQAICYSVKKWLKILMESYIDDMGAVSPNNLVLARVQFTQVCDLIRRLGLNLAIEKCEGPCRVLTWTGTTFDTCRMIMWIEKAKIEETLVMARAIMSNGSLTLKEMEVFIGKLQHAIKFCPAGRRFMNRLLSQRREMAESGSYVLSQGSIEDISWFIQFLADFNGVAVIRSQFVPTAEIFVDACLIGAGSFWKGKAHICYKWPKVLLDLDLSINDLELFNVLVTIRCWNKLLRGSTLRIWCDNHTSVKSILSGKARNNFMAGCLRELWLLTSVNDIFLDCQHIQGEMNEIADTLSRAYHSEEGWTKFSDFSKQTNTTLYHVTNDMLHAPQ